MVLSRQALFSISLRIGNDDRALLFCRGGGCLRSLTRLIRGLPRAVWTRMPGPSATLSQWDLNYSVPSRFPKTLDFTVSVPSGMSTNVSICLKFWKEYPKYTLRWLKNCPNQPVLPFLQAAEMLYLCKCRPLAAVTVTDAQMCSLLQMSVWGT